MINRLNKLEKIFIETGIDVLAIVPGSNFQYLTGGNFHLMERATIMLIKKDSNPIIILPSLEVETFKKLSLPCEIISWHDKEGYLDALKKAARLIGSIRNIGIEGQRMRFFEFKTLQEVFSNCQIINAHSEISSMRINKDNEEINNLKKAINISEKALQETIKFVEKNKTEMEIKQFLIQELFRNGAEGLSFDPIVLASTNSALPHGHSSNDYKIKNGDPILFDFGATINGYNADITRTLFLNSINDKQRNIYDIVLKANLVGIKHSTINNTLHNVDDSVSKVLEESPYKKFILHKTGHGLGLDVHEDPHVARNNNNKLSSGMVITIEPGIYDPSLLGVRIEDDVHITNDGPEILTSFPKELIII